MSSRLWVDFPRGAVLSILLSGAVFTSIWVPELAHWHVGPAQTTTSKLETARKVPDRAALEEIAAMHLAAVSVAWSQTLSTAERVMRGTLSLPGLDSLPITLPFAPENLEQGLPLMQLMVASLASADMLLDAYRTTRREDFFLQAREVILAFARFESAQWVDHGLMWNDHAVSARIPVLVKFWAEYRTRPDFDPAIGRSVLDLVARSAELLAKPSFYAWRTSHGTITDLALLQIAAAFPELPGAAEMRTIAASRFRDHLNYWINSEGVTLLHSAGYHAGSVYHFGLALRLFTLNGIKIPEEWWTRYAKAVDFHAMLRRPDGTLPMFGDTGSLPDETGPRLTARRDDDGTAEPLRERKPALPQEPFAVYPVAGHAIWWDGLNRSSDAATPTAAQTVLTWSYHPGLGHKLADELSMILWARGRTWLTNTGYWPYGVPGREPAESWEATNAPHLLGEGQHSERTSQLRAIGKGRGLAFIDIQRTGSAGYSVRRQVARLADEQSWVVVDHSVDSAAQITTTNWTFYPDLTVTPLESPGVYRVAAPSSTLGMVSSFSGSDGFKTELTAGSAKPFAGWVVLDRTPTRASAIVARQPSRDSWSLATFALVEGSKTSAERGGRMDKWVDAEHWTALVPTVSGNVMLTRAGSRLVSHHEGAVGADVSINLVERAVPAAELQAVRDSFRRASETYHRFPEIISYRVKVSRLLLAAFAAQEVGLFLMRRRLALTTRVLRIASWAGWAGAGLWLSQAYFAASI